MKCLVNRDSKGSLRIVQVEYKLVGEDYIIHRSTGIYKKKMTEQPDIIITTGKAKRTKGEQTELQFAHLVKEYKDKGYKELSKPLDEYSEQELSDLVGQYKTSQEGLLKPMLAKQYQDVKGQKTFDKNYYGSRKVNGVRCIIYYDKGELHTHSRGAISYDFVMEHILKHPKLIALFKENPTLILDGEIYKHGWTLNKISGICRSQKTAYDGEPLEFYMYDVVDLDKTFKERLEVINYISDTLNFNFNPTKDWEEDDLKIQVLPQEPISGFDNMMKLHDQYVSEGWEGLVVRLESAKYGPGKRTNDMIKIKRYFDAEYQITGLKEGLRPEDMCFTMVTENGQTFNAKPIGDRAQKQWYRDHLDDIIGKMATLKYFEMSGKEGSEVPQQPILLSIRDYE